MLRRLSKPPNFRHLSSVFDTAIAPHLIEIIWVTLDKRPVRRLRQGPCDWDALRDERTEGIQDIPFR